MLVLVDLVELTSPFVLVLAKLALLSLRLNTRVCVGICEEGVCVAIDDCVGVGTIDMGVCFGIADAGGVGGCGCGGGGALASVLGDDILSVLI